MLSCPKNNARDATLKKSVDGRAVKLLHPRAQPVGNDLQITFREFFSRFRPLTDAVVTLSLARASGRVARQPGEPELFHERAFAEHPLDFRQLELWHAAR